MKTTSVSATQAKNEFALVLERAIQGEKIVITKHDVPKAVMLSIENGKYYGLDGVGTDIWNLVVEPRSVAEICEKLLERYDVDAETCRGEVTSFLETLIADGSVVVVVTPS